MMHCDVLIVGGGIAGLWLLATLRAEGYQAYLATDQLGAGQTIASQGIIHGGTKYALTGQVSNATLAIGDMPKRWRAALAGEGQVNLSATRILAEHQLLWTSANIAAKLTGFFASKAMRSRMESLDKAEYPTLFQTPAFKGSLYRLDEPVLDVASLLVDFQTQYAPYLITINPAQSRLLLKNGQYQYQAALSSGQSVTIQAKRIVLTAGNGNEAIWHSTNPTSVPVMQRRPLHMLLVRGELPPLYAHALGVSDKPRMTITSYQDASGDAIWYLGGLPAEQGVGLNSSDAIKAAATELQSLLPWLDMRPLQWASWRVDRAEGVQAHGGRPDQPTVQRSANVMLAFPTKLAFAPALAQQVLHYLQAESVLASSEAVQSARPVFSCPTVATPVWQQCAFAKI